MKYNVKIDKLDKNIIIYIEFYLLGIIKIAKIRLTKKLMKKLKINQDATQIKKEAEFVKKTHLIKSLKDLKIKVKEIYLDLEFGTENIMFTVYGVAIISTIVANILRLAKTRKRKV